MTDIQSLIDSHYQTLYCFGFTLARCSHRATELVQQTFAIWAHQDQKYLDHFAPEIDLFHTLYHEHQNDHPDVVNMESHHSNAIEALAQIDEKYRASLALHYLQQHSYREIASILEIPIESAMERIAKGKNQLREILGSSKS